MLSNTVAHHSQYSAKVISQRKNVVVAWVERFSVLFHGCH